MSTTSTSVRTRTSSWPAQPTNSSFVHLSTKTKDTIASACSALCQTLVGHPLDSVKVRFQTSSAGSSTAASPLSIVKDIVKADGVRGLWRGMGLQMIMGQQLTNVVLFGSYQHFRRMLDPRYRYIGAANPSSPGWHMVVAASAAGLLNSFILCPAELLKSVLQAHSIKYANTRKRVPPPTAWQVLKTQWRRGGLRGMYRGMDATMAREGIGAIGWLGMYEVMRMTLTKPGEENPPLWKLAVSGGTAGLAFWILAFPWDSAKTRIQFEALETRNPAARQYRNVAQTMMKMVRADGVMSLYRGFSIAVARSAFFVAPAIIVSYEVVRSALD